MICARCNQPINDGDIYFEAKRRGQHDVYRETPDGCQIYSVPLYFHIDCENRT